MSSELVYTSAAKGLKPGSSGFCTVAASISMPRIVISKLEMLSAYEFTSNVSGREAHFNPVNFAHTIIPVGSESRSVLSRIAFSGSDYSGRTNKIAHHFLLETEDRLPQGPVAILNAIERNGLFCKNWTSEAHELSVQSLSTLSLPMDTPCKCQSWQEFTGDSGWAGVFINAFYTSKRLPSYIIFEAGQNVLPLFEDCLRLMPTSIRWQVCFATYYSSLPAGCYYHWRGVLAGSAATKEIARHPGAMVIDVTKPLVPAPEDIYCQKARQGEIIEPPAIKIALSSQTIPTQKTVEETKHQSSQHKSSRRIPYAAYSCGVEHLPIAHSQKNNWLIRGLLAAVIVLFVFLITVVFLLWRASSRQLFSVNCKVPVTTVILTVMSM